MTRAKEGNIDVSIYSAPVILSTEIRNWMSTGGLSTTCHCCRLWSALLKDRGRGGAVDAGGGSYFLRCSARELPLVWANMSKSSCCWGGAPPLEREHRVPLTLPEPMSTERERERGREGKTGNKWAVRCWGPMATQDETQDQETSLCAVCVRCAGGLCRHGDTPGVLAAQLCSLSQKESWEKPEGTLS